MAETAGGRGSAGKASGRAVIEAMLERGEKNFESRDLRDLDLAELDLEGASFRGADARASRCNRLEGDQAGETNIRGTDWTDATIADLGPQAVFQYVNAEQAAFRVFRNARGPPRAPRRGRREAVRGGFRRLPQLRRSRRQLPRRDVASHRLRRRVDPDGAPSRDTRRCSRPRTSPDRCSRRLAPRNRLDRVASLDGRHGEGSGLASPASRSARDRSPDLAAGITLSDPQDDARGADARFHWRCGRAPRTVRRPHRTAGGPMNGATFVIAAGPVIVERGKSCS